VGSRSQELPKLRTVRVARGNAKMWGVRSAEGAGGVGDEVRRVGSQRSSA